MLGNGRVVVINTLEPGVEHLARVGGERGFVGAQLEAVRQKQSIYLKVENLLQHPCRTLRCCNPFGIGPNIQISPACPRSDRSVIVHHVCE